MPESLWENLSLVKRTRCAKMHSLKEIHPLRVIAERNDGKLLCSNFSCDVEGKYSCFLKTVEKYI